MNTRIVNLFYEFITTVDLVEIIKFFTMWMEENYIYLSCGTTTGFLTYRDSMVYDFNSNIDRI